MATPLKFPASLTLLFNFQVTIRMHVVVVSCTPGPSDARIAAAASHFTVVFLACAWCREISRILEIPHWIRRRRDRLLCAPPARPALQVRAHCLLACLASSCSAISATAVQPCSATHCGIGRRETLRASTQIAYTRAHCLLDCCHSVLRRHALPSAPLPCNPAVPPTAG